MISVIILLKDQKRYLTGIVDAITAQTVRPGQVILAVDRCLSDYEAASDIARENGWDAIHANVGMEDAGVLIGRTRNEALKLVQDDHHVIFTDGDCVPSTTWIEHHAHYLSTEIPTATTGCRFAQTEAGVWEEDIRITKLPYKNTFSKEADKLVLGHAAESTMMLFGCNMGLNAAAIRLIKDRSAAEIFERTVFASVFDGEWGFEETSLGPVLYDAGARLIALSPKTSSVKHYWHPSRGAGVRGSKVSEEYLHAMRKPSIGIVRQASMHKRRSANWVMSCTTLVNAPMWWDSVFGYLSAREQAQLACVLYTNVVDIEEETNVPCGDLTKVKEAIEIASNGIELPAFTLTRQDIEMHTPSIFGTTNSNSVAVSVIIPLHNQTHNVERIFIALGGQTKIPHEYVVVVDRCTDTTVTAVITHAQHLKTKMVLVHRRESDEGFRAGQVRNLGVSHKTQGRVIFLDGDCVPCPTWVEAHMTAMDEAGDRYPVATFGLRKDQLKEGVEEYRNDTRTYRSMTPIFWKGRNLPVMNRGTVYGHMATWSCNLGLNTKAVELLTQLNGSVFSPLLTVGKWGGEDTYLGMQLWDNWGMLIAVSPEEGHVKHIWHPRAKESALGSEANLTHSKDATVFSREAADMADTVENNLIRSRSAENIPGIYKLLLERELPKSQCKGITQRALAYLCARSIEFTDSTSEAYNKCSADSMYKEILRLRSNMTALPMDVATVAMGMSTRIDCTFDPVIEEELEWCPKCKTFMPQSKSDRCPMCRQKYNA